MCPEELGNSKSNYQNLAFKKNKPNSYHKYEVPQLSRD
ncbi:hypothetical protein RINTHH_19260 [Richelia intracellularis HH01]|uniref:Uncharacterized protein n=1 Tax=Richelia intracellularis HH01 TaxID=1165094 RepID=M1X6E5_9NOST|nr:hypothetical protein RINTHH_19260 [Richelia intracellularis HH01]